MKFLVVRNRPKRYLPVLAFSRPERISNAISMEETCNHSTAATHALDDHYTRVSRPGPSIMTLYSSTTSCKEDLCRRQCTCGDPLHAASCSGSSSIRLERPTSFSRSVLGSRKFEVRGATLLECLIVYFAPVQLTSMKHVTCTITSGRLATQKRCDSDGCRVAVLLLKTVCSVFRAAVDHCTIPPSRPTLLQK